MMPGSMKSATFDEHQRRRGPAMLQRDDQRRGAGAEMDVGIRTGVEQRFDRRRVGLDRGEHERRESAPGCRIQCRAELNQAGDASRWPSAAAHISAV